MTVPAWGGRRMQQACARVKARDSAVNAPCYLCKQPLDYSLTAPHPDRHSVEHIKTRRDFPELTWDYANMASAHLSCNLEKGARDRGIDGIPSEDW